MKTTTFGIVVTALYIALVLSIRWASLPTLQTMPLNEFGDFFAGVFGPLMLFWLILGYIQQQKELKQNTKALQIQADELKNSVEQYKELVKTSKRQVETEIKALEIKQDEARREAQPSFSITDAGRAMKSGGNSKYQIRIRNNGQSASDVRVTTSPAIEQINNYVFPYFQNGESKVINWESKVCGPAPSKLKLIINCRDMNMQGYMKSFDLVLDESNKYHLEGIASVS